MKIIKTISAIKYSETIKPAKSFVPDWYKKSDKYLGANTLRVGINGDTNLGIKACSPFLDSLTTGYIATLWQDLYVENTNLGISVRWRAEHERSNASIFMPPISERPKSNGPAEHLPTPAGHIDQHFTWLHPYSFKVPDGYSLIVTHPFNRFDLPFTTLSGIVDADIYPMTPGNIPFFIKEGFSGIISKGTPIFQILPFKRESWKAEVDEDLLDKVKEARFKSISVFSGWYKKESWNKKHYE